MASLYNCGVRLVALASLLFLACVGTRDYNLSLAGPTFRALPQVSERPSLRAPHAPRDHGSRGHDRTDSQACQQAASPRPFACANCSFHHTLPTSGSCTNEGARDAVGEIVYRAATCTYSLYADFIVFCFSANMTTLRSTAIPCEANTASVYSSAMESRRVYRPCAAGPSPCTFWRRFLGQPSHRDLRVPPPSSVPRKDLGRGSRSRKTLAEERQRRTSACGSL